MDGNLWVLRKADGTYTDLTGWTFDLHFRLTLAATGDPAWGLSTALPGLVGSLTLIDGDGIRTATVRGVETVLEELGFVYLVELGEAIPPLTAATWYWDIQGTDPSGRVQTYEAGTLTITQDVTRP